MKVYNSILSFFTRDTLKQFGKYITSGILSAALEYFLIIMLTEFAGFWYIVSNTIAMSGGFCLSFILNRYWSFKSYSKISRQLLLNGLLFLINLALSNALMYLLTGVTGLPYTMSKLIAMGIIAIWNFIIYKGVIFRK